MIPEKMMQGELFDAAEIHERALQRLEERFVLQVPGVSEDVVDLAKSCVKEIDEQFFKHLCGMDGPHPEKAFSEETWALVRRYLRAGSKYPSNRALTLIIAKWMALAR